MLQRESITIDLTILNLAMIILAALLLGFVGFALGTGLEARYWAAAVDRSPGIVQEPAVITGDDPAALGWFLEMDRVALPTSSGPAVITGDDPEALKWFLEMDRLALPTSSGPALISGDDPEALKWFLEMDRVALPPTSAPAVITGDDPEALKWFLEMDRVSLGP